MRPAQDPGDAEPKRHRGKPGQRLLDTEDHHGKTEERRETEPRGSAAEHPEPGSLPRKAEQRPGHRAHRHEALGAEVQHPGPLREHHAETGQQQRQHVARQHGEPCEEEIAHCGLRATTR
nr:hypothetical protein [Alloyangia mangrovi]